MDDHEVNPDIRQRLEDLRQAIAPVDPDAPRIPLQVIAFQPFDGNEVSPIIPFEVYDPNSKTMWHGLIMLNDRDLWLLTMLDFIRGIVPEASGSSYITVEDAWRSALLVAGEREPAR